MDEGAHGKKAPMGRRRPWEEGAYGKKDSTGRKCPWGESFNGYKQLVSLRSLKVDQRAARRTQRSGKQHQSVAHFSCALLYAETGAGRSLPSRRDDPRSVSVFLLKQTDG